MTRISLILIFVLTACNLTPAEAATAWPTATTVLVSPVPTVSRELHAVASVEPSATVFVEDCETNADKSAARHTIIADVNYAQHTVAVEQDIHFANRTTEPLTQIILNVEANRWLGAFTLDKLVLKNSGGEESPGYALTGRQLTIDLPQTLEPDCEVHLQAKYRLLVPAIAGGLDAYRGFFGYSPRQLNLGHWLLTVAARDTDWITHQAIFIGEQYVLEVADWDVTLSVSEAASTLVVAAPGEMSKVSDRVWRFNLPAARDFTVSMSEQFTRTTQETENGATIELYTFADAQVITEAGASLDAAAYSLDLAAKSLAMYSDLFGAYPYERMLIVQGDFPDGMEFSGLVFVSGDWFRTYDGTPMGYLMVITIHEVAHQWWYAVVGNDSAINPWLDEALATYSEYIFVEEYYPDLKEWWWQWRVDRLSPQGYVDSTVYQFSTIREYINAVYLRGVHMLHDVRQAIGTDAFFELLRQYAETASGQIATPELFWSLLTPEQAKLTLITRHRYLFDPNIGDEGN